MPIDLVMWTRNGEKTLPFVLTQINRVVPSEKVHKRYVIDDQSKDRTRQIAHKYGWQVLPNVVGGISNAANMALSLVDCPVFCSFEQDVVLADNWYNKVAPNLDYSRVAVTSGMRFASKPRGVQSLQKYEVQTSLGSRRRSELNAFLLGKTLDNTMYRTVVMRKVGFPRGNAGVDVVLAFKLRNAGCEWKVNYDVQSLHLRSGLHDELKHQYWYGTQTRMIWSRVDLESTYKFPISHFSVVRDLFKSLFSSVFVALRSREATVVYVQPLVNFYFARGLLRGFGMSCKAQT